MIRSTSICALFFVTACTSTSSAVRPAGSVDLTEPAVFSPERGVICDDLKAAGVKAEVAGACFDRDGISPKSTATYFGEDAAKRIAERMDALGRKYDRSSFRLSDGVACNIYQQRCWSSSAGGPEPAKRHMEALFDVG